MLPTRSPPGSRFRGGKRLSGHLSPTSVCSPKRTKATPRLLDYDQVHQYILLAAAMILCVPIEKLLALARFSHSSSRNSSSEHLDDSSNSSFNDHADGFTPPQTSESEKTTNSYDFPLPGGPQPPSAAFEGNDPRPDQGLKATDMNNNIDLFASTEPYPTPPHFQQSFSASEVGDMFMANSIWQEHPGSDFSLPPFKAQSTGNDPTAFVPSTSSPAELGNLPIPNYGAALQLEVDRTFQDFQEQNYPNVDWSVLAPDDESTSMDFLVPTLDHQGEPFHFHGTQELSETASARKDGGVKGKRRGPFRVAEQRQETGLTRKLGACIRCSMQRVRCIPDPSSLSGCCRTCIQSSQRPRWLPCLRYKITDAELLDHDVCPRPTWTTRWKKMELIDITNWASSAVKEIQVTQGVGNTSYTLQVRQFRPVEGDALARHWKIDGNPYTYECAPYAVSNMKQAGKTLRDFAQSSLTAAIRFWVDDQDPLLRRTYNMAYIYSINAEREEDRSLLAATLRMWAASRMMSRAAHICGTETLGMQARDYGPKSASSGKILMPPVFSAQMEVIIVAEILQPTKKEVLNRLKALVYESNRRSWLAIYLCVFLLLHSCALLTKRDHERAVMQGVQRRFYRPRLIDELHNGAKILLAYFHFCNRGTYPLHMDWTSADQIALAELKPEQIEFMRGTVKELEKKSAHFKTVLDTCAYEDEYYFIAQLCERDWKPRHTV
ncbi:uncharacterized protein BDZ99DRAFT_497671 [Mytilinidion resinicola]|uniref:Zn(2)-C6 fungal-type domain-containing protein n=1 Tax=Mytilinidion resinicola TaxID=574789 RepID=A0A6A6YP66_9PEZI|nr:uncharacterized protein BDZ99DRAFT_497671 [Mytilinidion resinicola]KAF2810686.1 hypothetical protein BDZ99DRAFT_497671 [Mytilinidion resinicola]